jgi:hypothetical protein
VRASPRRTSRRCSRRRGSASGLRSGDVLYIYTGWGDN